MSVPQSHRQLRLADHARACQVGNRLIFLDLHRSKYVGVGGPRLPALAKIILGTATPDDAGEQPSNPTLTDDWVRRLCRLELLADEPANKPRPSRPEPIEPFAGLTMDDRDRAAGLDWHDLVDLWRATLVTTTWLSCYNLAQIADRVTALRKRRSDRSRGLAGDAMLAEAASYLRLRPFALTAHDRCLRDSLTLIHFLASRGLFPRWIIGVRIQPFGAHSWVQWDDVVLNDQLDHVRHYRPILVV